MRTFALLLLSLFVCMPAVTLAKTHSYKHASRHHKGSRKQRRAYKRAQKQFRTLGVKRHRSRAATY